MRLNEGSAGQMVVVSLLFSVVLVVLTLQLFSCRYDTNDDVLMTLIASGLAFGRAPDCHITNSHLLIGMFLSKLYSTNQHVPWYGLYQISCILISTVTIAFCFLFGKPLRQGCLLFLVFYVFAIMHMVACMQFTTTAAVLCMAALFLLIRYSEDSCNNYWRYALPVLLFLLASLVRVESFAQFAVLGTVYFVSKKIPDRRRRAYALLTLGLSFLLALSLHKWDIENVESDAGWHHYWTLNRAAAPFTNYDYIQPLLDGSPALRAANWDDADAEMLASWNFLDRNVFTVDNFRKVARLAVPREFPLALKLKILLQIARDPAILPLAIICVLSLFLLQNSARCRLLIYFAINLALLFLIGLLLHMVARVYYPMFCFSAMVAIWELAKGSSIPSETADCLGAEEDCKVSSGVKSLRGAGRPNAHGLTRKWRFAIGVLTVWGFISWLNFAFIEPGNTARKLRKRVLQAITDLHPNRNDLYLGWDYPYLAILPFDDVTEYFDNMIICPMAGFCQSPIVTDVIRRFGLNNVLLELDNPHVLVISSSGLNDILIRFLQKHYAKEWGCQEVAAFGPVGVYRFERNMLPGKEIGSWRCSTSRADKVLRLFPSKDQAWSYFELHEVKQEGTLLSKLASFVSKLNSIVVEPVQSTCTHCQAGEKQGARFASAEHFPTLSHFGTMQLSPRTYPHFYIKVAVAENLSLNREVYVQLRTKNSGLVKFQIPLQSDENMHRYEFSLDSLGMPNNEIVTDMSISPVFVREPGEKSSFVLKEFGLAHNRDDEAGK